MSIRVLHDTRSEAITDELVLVLGGLDQTAFLVRQFNYVPRFVLEWVFYIRDMLISAVTQIYEVALTLT